MFAIPSIHLFWLASNFIISDSGYLFSVAFCAWCVQQPNRVDVSKPRKVKLKKMIFNEGEDPLPVAKRHRTDSFQEDEPIAAAPVSH